MSSMWIAYNFTHAGDGKISYKMNYVTVKTFKMKSTLAVITLALVSCCANDADTYMSRFIADLWLEGTGIVKIIWKDCSKKLVAMKNDIDAKESYPKFMKCMKRKTLKALDRSLSPDVVPIADGVNLVRFEIVDTSGNVVQENDTSVWTEKELEEEDWKHLALQRMAKVLQTHVIKFDFDDKIVDKVEYRGRRRYHMMTMMMFGIVSIGMVLVPMGFQFLAVLGGKALLLAKMALILASIQGLKKVDAYDGYRQRGKIAASPISYGFYQPFSPYEHFDKRSHNDWQENKNAIQSKILNTAVNEDDEIKVNKLNVMEPRNDENKETNRKSKELRQFPLYVQAFELPSKVNYAPIDTPTPTIDITSRPGEVQAEYTLDLPYNGFHFQSPTPVVST